MAEMKVLSDIKDLQGRLTTIGTNALQYKGHFNGDLNTLFGLDKVGIYALQHQCTNTPNDTDNYVFERAILTVKSDGTSTTHDLIATHFEYPTYVGKQYKRTGWVGADWQPWKCLDDEKLNRQGVTESASNLILPSQFQYLLYNYDKGNFAGIGVGADGAINLRAGTSNELATYLKILGGGTATLNDKKIVTSDEITALQAKTYQELPILRSGTVLNHILSSNVRYGLFNTVYDASTTDAPDTYWGTCRFTKQASNVWTVEWLSSVGNKRYQRTIYVDHWQEDKWSILATTERLDVSSQLMGGWTPVSNCGVTLFKNGNMATVSALMLNSGVSNNAIDLSFLKPSDGKWHGGIAMGSDNYGKYIVINPDGFVNFQTGYVQNVSYSINLSYPI